MKFMNEYDVLSAQARYENHPVLGPAVQTLRNLVEWTNANSDGWPYWAKPCRAAEKLQELIEPSGNPRAKFDEERDDVTPADVRAALRPIKTFRTRHGATFEIIEP